MATKMVEAVVLTSPNLTRLREAAWADLCTLQDGNRLWGSEDMSEDMERRDRAAAVADLAHVLDVIGWEPEFLYDGENERDRVLPFSPAARRALQLMLDVRWKEEDADEIDWLEGLLDMTRTPWSAITGEEG